MKRFLVALLFCCTAGVAHAQQLPPAADSAITRALNEAARDTATARTLLDSIATARESSPLVRGEASYWLAQLTPTSERERALAALIVDHSFSPRVPDALFELATLELARNERDAAVLHFSRFLASAVDDTNRAGAALTLGRLLLERGELPRACAVLLNGRGEAPETSIELRNQFEFSASRCQGVDTTTKVQRRPTDTASAPRRTGAFTVQVAAYDTRQAAERLAATLRGQGLEARVVGSAKPFRVRVGRYATRGEAESASDRVDRVAKSKSIVVVVGPEER
jgi:hypothetical protein